MHLVILFIFLGLAALIVWLADWTSGTARTPTAIDILNRRLARGEINRAEYDEKLRMIGTRRRR
jgi:uncharacterized membrane protein